MNNKIELLNDYRECIEKMKKLKESDCKTNIAWAKEKYIKWISKDENFKYSINTINGTKPSSEIEAAYNSLNNLKRTLELIALKEDFNYNQ